MRRPLISTVTAAALLVLTSQASAAIVINEVDSDAGKNVADWVELKNTGNAPVDVAGYVFKDSDDGHAMTLPAASVIPAGGWLTFDVTAFGLGDKDSARLFAPGDVLVDSVSWTSEAATSLGRCPDGTGPFGATISPTHGAANGCPVAGTPWLGASPISVADAPGVFGTNLSGLAYQPSGTSARGVLYAVQNGPSKLWRLIYDGAKWMPDPANGWINGKTLVYPDGGGVPDAEGVTLVDGAAFVSTERNDDGVHSDISRPSVLRFDLNSPATTLTATREFDLTADLPGLDKNEGLEAIAWLPDSLLVAKGFIDEHTGLTYYPPKYFDHGDGLFFVGVEQTGQVLAYALNQTTGSYVRVATIDSGFSTIMDLEYEPETTHLYAVCDDTCGGQMTTLDVDSGGHFAVTNRYDRPAGMPNLNNEGFAVAPQAECVNGLKPTFYADDTNDDGHALRTGSINCTVAMTDPVPTPTPQPAPKPEVQPRTIVAPMVIDRTPPKLKLALKVRRTGASITVTTNERANLTVSAKVKSRRLLKTTRKGVSGKATFTVKRKLRKGQTVTLTVQARDAAGNLATGKVSAKVR